MRSHFKAKTFQARMKHKRSGKSVGEQVYKTKKKTCGTAVGEKGTTFTMTAAPYKKR